jgi:hypothetical protein
VRVPGGKRCCDPSEFPGPESPPSRESQRRALSGIGDRSPPPPPSGRAGKGSCSAAPAGDPAGPQGLEKETVDRGRGGREQRGRAGAGDREPERREEGLRAARAP